MNRPSRLLLIPPPGGRFVNQLAKEEVGNRVVKKVAPLPPAQLSVNRICNLALLHSGRFSPHNQFERKRDYEGVIEKARLVDGTLFSISVTSQLEKKPGLRPDGTMALLDNCNSWLAVSPFKEFSEIGLFTRGRILPCPEQQGFCPSISNRNSDRKRHLYFGAFCDCWIRYQEGLIG